MDPFTEMGKMLSESDENGACDEFDFNHIALKIMVGNLRGNFHLTSRHTKLEFQRGPYECYD